ncbi:Maf-like protein [sediment metagenome]|uniref:Maf-like protein n=1 Tax=sediment metagenome TaxID=749907 RepID=D9PH50_9ZZZZ
MPKIILASTSPRRKALLSQLGLEFEVVHSDYDEDMTLAMEPVELAKFLSAGKADAVYAKYPKDIIIAADTFVVMREHILGKPHTPERAKEMLQKISGQKLQIITGLTVINEKQKISRAVSTDVFIKKLSIEEIENYVATGEPLDKAGAFAIQEKGAALVEKIEGDYNSAVGLPLDELVKILQEMGAKIF